MINHVGNSIGSLIENDISKFLSPKSRVCKHEQSDNSQASQETDRFPGPSDEESLEARKCHRRSHRHGCKCHKKHRSGHGETVEESPVAEEIYEERRHHRRHGRKRKSHICPVHRLDSASPSEKSPPVSTPNPEVENIASSSKTVFPTIAICPPKLPGIGSHSKSSQSVPSPPKDYSHFSFLNDVSQNNINPFISLKSDPVEDNVERSRRPYSLKSLIMAPDVESHTPAAYSEPIKSSQDPGQEINPADVALISGIVALRDMGFHDDAANLDALQAHFGRLEDAIEELLKF
ncbi:hypothetical protein DSO57_1028161 [Entomophthora muscae]|uniref:Uncharacterized protein n=1 Tax=Entomophthora muscae TaxID=34485 RepID=A0ACC2SQJ5_9FUNG|nr:hypothetical protein DSO57_1028161 [Entomophthora muscae]